MEFPCVHINSSVSCIKALLFATLCASHRVLGWRPVLHAVPRQFLQGSQWVTGLMVNRSWCSQWISLLFFQTVSRCCCLEQVTRGPGSSVQVEQTREKRPGGLELCGHRKSLIYGPKFPSNNVEQQLIRAFFFPVSTPQPRLSINLWVWAVCTSVLYVCMCPRPDMCRHILLVLEGD